MGKTCRQSWTPWSTPLSANHAYIWKRSRHIGRVGSFIRVTWNLYCGSVISCALFSAFRRRRPPVDARLASPPDRPTCNNTNARRRNGAHAVRLVITSRATRRPRREPISSTAPDRRLRWQTHGKVARRGSIIDRGRWPTAVFLSRQPRARETAMTLPQHLKLPPNHRPATLPPRRV